jgi:hypothetical protein
MSLSEHLKDSGSPVRAYLDGVWPGAVRLRERSAAATVEALGLPDLVRCTTVVPPAAGVDAKRNGTAIDFRARIALGGFDPYDSAAALGVAELPFHTEGLENGAQHARVLAEAFDVAVRILENPADEVDLDRASILLACCEQVHRGGSKVFKGSLGEALDEAEDGRAFARKIEEPSLADIRALMEVNASQLNMWRERVARGGRFEPNPVFAGSRLVGGADGDWIVGDALIESKAYAELTVPLLRGFIRQLLGYVMLDLEDALAIRSIGLWLPRQQVTKVWPLEQVLGGNPEDLLAKLRKGFVTAANGRGTAVRVPVTQRRMQQILAENKHTPRRMLIELARSEDADVRMRVGRNVITPEATVREIARDRYAKVRAGVANNENAPVDVLETLSRDSSVGVQSAARRNPRTPRTAMKELGRGQSAMDSTDLATPVSDGAPLRGGNVRDSEGMNTRWFAEFLDLARNARPSWRRSGLPLPEASRWAAMTEGRSLKTPDWLTAGLPDAVLQDLLRIGRPAWVRRAVARDLHISDPALRDQLLADPDPEIRWSTLRRTVDEPAAAISELLGRLATDKKERARFRTGGDDLPSWRGDQSPAERDNTTLALVAAHPSTPATALRDLMASKSPDILVSLMGNPALPEEDLIVLLPRLRAVRSNEARERLAASRCIPPATADALVRDREARVRAALAANASAPTHVLSRLSEDPEPYVRLGLIRNPIASVDLAGPIAAALLTSSLDTVLLDVLRAVARRDDLQVPTAVLEAALDKLSKSRVRAPDLRRSAAEDLRTGSKTLTRLAKSADEEVRRTVAANPRVPPDVLAALASDSDPSVRRAAAGNEGLDSNPLAHLAHLAHDAEPDVRASVARNRRLDPSLLAELLLDHERDVASAAYRNPSLREEDKARAELEWDRAWRASAPSRADLEEMVASTRAEVRIRAARDPRTPSDILRFLGGERRSAKVRAAAAANSSTPPDVLASLAGAQDPEVHQAVAFNSAAPAGVLGDLARRRVDLALLVALNPDVQPDTLAALAQDNEPLIAHIASATQAARTLPSGPTATSRRAIETGADSLTKR